MNINKGKILYYDDFREFVSMDAYQWYRCGYDADELTPEDILNEFPEGYFSDSENDEHDENSAFFTPSEFAEAILKALTRLAEEE